MGGRRGSEQGRKEIKKIILEVPLAQSIELHHAENAWKPSVKEPVHVKDTKEPAAGGEEISESVSRTIDTSLFIVRFLLERVQL
jgi:hypothetical protein